MRLLLKYDSHVSIEVPLQYSLNSGLPICFVQSLMSMSFSSRLPSTHSLMSTNVAHQLFKLAQRAKRPIYHIPQLVVAVEIVKDAHVHRNDGEDYARQRDSREFVDELDADEDDCAWANRSLHKSTFNLGGWGRLCMLTHNAEQTGAEYAEIIVHRTLRILVVVEHGQFRCHVGLSEHRDWVNCCSNTFAHSSAAARSSALYTNTTHDTHTHTHEHGFICANICIN